MSSTDVRSTNVRTALDHLFEAFDDHDADRAVAAYAPDIRFRMHSSGTELVGPEAVHAMHEQLFAAFSDAHTNVLEVIDAGDVVVFEFELLGTNDGPYMGLDATGKSVNVRVCDVVRFGGDGKIISEDNYMDSLSMARQLGLVG